jgi:hypothetical protein
MGLGEGVTFPCIQNLVAGNVPELRKPRSLSLIYSGIQVCLVGPAGSAFSCMHCRKLHLDAHVDVVQLLRGFKSSLMLLPACALCLPTYVVALDLPSHLKILWSSSWVLYVLQAGTIVSLLSAPLIIRNAGWPSVFFLFGTVGFVWLLFWQPLAIDKPRTKSLRAADGISNGDNVASQPMQRAIEPDHAIALSDDKVRLEYLQYTQSALLHVALLCHEQAE